MSGLVVELDRVRRAVATAPFCHESREQAIARTLAKIQAETRDQQQHAAHMAAMRYDTALRRHVGAYTVPGGAS